MRPHLGEVSGPARQRWRLWPLPPPTDIELSHIPRWAYREPVDKFAQAAIVELPKKILLPSAICRIDGAREAEGMLKVSADCEDSISFTSRSVMIALRSTTELVYSASSDWRSRQP